MTLSEELQGIHPSSIRFPGYLSQRAQRALAQTRKRMGISPSDKSRDDEVLAEAIRDALDAPPEPKIFYSKTAPNEWMASCQIGNELVTVTAPKLSEAIQKINDRLAEDQELSPNGRSHYVWVLRVGSSTPLSTEGPYGPMSPQEASQYARISATEGIHDRAVSVGKDPEASGFRIVRRYAAGTGERLI